MAAATPIPAAALPPWALAVRFVDAVNTNDIDCFAELMSDDHVLKLFSEAPSIGREEVLAGWRGYCSSWPQYVIYPHRMAQTADTIAILGHTTGSHLGLPDAEESKLTLIWLCHCQSGKVTSWELIEDTSQNRSDWSLE